MGGQLVITDDDKSPLLLILILFLLVVSIVSVFSQVTIRYALTKTISDSDWVAVAAILLSIAQSISISISTNHGLGVQESLLTPTGVSQTAKALYVADLFYWPILGCCKVSILLFIERLAASRLQKRTSRYTMCAVIGWSFIATITLALRCGSTAPWTSNATDRCIDLHSFWLAASITDLLPEVVIIVLPAVMVWPVQLPRSKKLLVATVFAIRVVYCMVVIARLFFLPAPMNEANFTFADINPTVLTQAVLCAAITTACLPALRPVLEAFNSGGMTLHIRQDHIYYGSGKGRSTPGSRMQSHQLSFLSPPTRTQMSSISNTRQDAEDAKDTSDISITQLESQQELEERASTSSLARSEQMIITKDTVWSVTYEPNNHAR